MSSRHIVVVGSLNADLVARVDHLPGPGETVVGRDFAVIPGGKGANQAYAAARLGGAVSMVGRVGGDSHGDLLKASLALAGVDVSHVQAQPGVPTGIALITVDRTGQNHIVIVPGANAAFGAADLDQSRDLIASAAVVLLQLEVPLATVESAARLARQGGALVILDPAPAAPIPSGLLQMADYLTPNETELAALAGSGPVTGRGDASQRARQLLHRGARKVVVKLGAEGALLIAPAGERFWPALAVEAVDATAAGDAWNGAFAFALARGATEADAGELATAAAACSVTRRGAQPSMPALSEAEAMLRPRS